MTPFQTTALIVTCLWSALVVLRFRRSVLLLTGGLTAIGLLTLGALVTGQVTPAELGLGLPPSWLWTFGLAILGFIILAGFSPLADRLASHWIAQPPRLANFQGVQRSILALILGIGAAWLLGGFLEELVARGIVLRAVSAGLASWLGLPVASGVAILAAAAGAGLMHLYQGPRAVIIIAQLSVLLGCLYVLSGYNLWVVMICHGLYDTLAMVRFALRKSKYARLDEAGKPSD